MLQHTSFSCKLTFSAGILQKPPIEMNKTALADTIDLDVSGSFQYQGTAGGSRPFQSSQMKTNDEKIYILWSNTLNKRS